ncbi:glycosyltransferase, partial [Noviherbaspirillum sp.]|uniref:glycosyltransferase n=1 Tax=Noviherbaspirillum sp. TaxID=1926288 RepID=UPI002D5FE0A4
IDSELEKQACDALIEKLGIANKVTFITDFLPEAECLARLQTADLIVYPYQHTQESASGAVRIGIAAGRPVAVTPLPIFDDVAGAVHVLPGTEPEALASGIKRLLDDPAEIGRQAARTQQWVAAREWPLLSVRLLNIIDGLANPLTTDARNV